MHMALRREDVGHIFRAYDIRGIYNEDLLPEFFVEIGLAAAERLGGKCLVGMDVRASSPVLYEALIAGLRAGGVKVLDAGTIPIGALLYGCCKMEEGFSAYITASHLPPEWNGVKFYFAGGLGVEPEDNYELRDAFLKGNYRRLPWEGVGERVRVDLLSEYLEFLLESFKLEGLKVGLDCGNGATVLTAPRAFRGAGATVKGVNCFVDPSFPGRGAEPRPENIKELSELVVSRGLDFGVAYDGDGDRGLFVDKDGRYLYPEEVVMIIIEGLKLRGSVVTTVDASKVLEDYCRERGLKLIRVPVGHNYVIRKVREAEAVVGVEHSGHILVPGMLDRGKPFAVDDALWASMKFAEAYLQLGGSFKEFLPERYVYRSLKVRVGEREKVRVVEWLKERLMSMYGEVETVDGVKVDLGDAWALVRPSNTEPVVRISVEAKEEAKASRLLGELRRLLEEAKGVNGNCPSRGG